MAKSTLSTPLKASIFSMSWLVKGTGMSTSVTLISWGPSPPPKPTSTVDTIMDSWETKRPNWSTINRSRPLLSDTISVTRVAPMTTARMVREVRSLRRHRLEKAIDSWSTSRKSGPPLVYDVAVTHRDNARDVGGYIKIVGDQNGGYAPFLVQA